MGVASDRESPAERFRMTLALFELAEAQMRQRLRRQHAGASDEEIDGRVQAWLLRRPGAEHGDAVGRPIPWPPRR
jgi:Rv0078B-related antitoxin